MTGFDRKSHILNKGIDCIAGAIQHPYFHSLRRRRAQRNLMVRIDSYQSNVFPCNLPPLFLLIFSVGTNASIHLGQVMFITEMDHGTPSNCTDAYLELICDFANKWYSKKTGVDCRSTGTDPKFTCLNSNFRKNFEEYGAEWLAGLETTRYFTRAQFWKLRYLFIPISFVASRHKNKKNVMHHVALCAISPEARTVDYICSAGDK